MELQTEATYTTGDVVYTKDGTQCVFVATLPDGFCVRPLYDAGEDCLGETVEGDPTIVDRVFTIAPAKITDEQLSELHAQIRDAQAQLDDIMDKTNIAWADMQARKDALRVHKGLERLDDYIAGRITHVVMVDYSRAVIKDFKTAFKQDGYSQKLRLLALFGDSNGKLDWKVNDYHDGSGSFHTCIPCCSYEEAVKACGEVIQSQWKAADSDHAKGYAAGFYIRTANEIDLEIPDEVRQADFSFRYAAVHKELTEAESRAKRAKAAFKQLTDEPIYAERLRKDGKESETA